MTFDLTVAQGVARARQLNPRLNVFVTERLDEAERQAAELATEAPRSALHGLPYSLKDEWETLHMPTTGGSWRHRERQSRVDSLVYSTLEAAGAVLLGKTNLSDMGLAPEAINYIVGPTRNPHDPERTAGGSSGGSAAAVAAGISAFDWGTDIGGSIRMPAAFCGVLGMRLSHQTWPIRDLFPVVPEKLTWMCGQGPFTHTTEQMRAVLDTLAPSLGTGTAESFTPKGVLLYLPEKLGPWASFADDATAHLQAAFDGPVEDSGDRLPATQTVKEIYGSLWASHMDELVTADETLTFRQGAGAVLSSLFLRGVFGDKRFHPSTAELLALMATGSYTIFRSKEKALANARKVRDAFEAVWADGWVIASPVCVLPPFRVGRGNRTPNLLTCTVPGNVADATGLSIPLGTFGGLPRGIQLQGPPGSEQILLDAADRFIASRERIGPPGQHEDPEQLQGA